MLPAGTHDDGLSPCRVDTRWHFFIPGFAVANHPTVAVSRFSIDHLLLLEVLQHAPSV